jgi:hypothetical protein
MTAIVDDGQVTDDENEPKEAIAEESTFCSQVDPYVRINSSPTKESRFSNFLFCFRGGVV